ncbi:branched-chain amino acid ABC transporter permease [soil metagenome]
MQTTTYKPAVSPSLGQKRSISKMQIGMLLAIVVVAALPLVLTNYRLLQLSQILVFAIALLGLNLLTGFNGQISLGHGAFYAVGAYAVAIMLDKTGVPYWAAIPIAGGLSFVVGFLFGLPALRLEGHYLALATFALAIAVPQILKYNALGEWTGGVQGLSVVQPSAPWGLPLGSDQWLYYFCLAWAIVLFVLGWNLLRGRIGRAIVAIPQHHIAAETMGINTSYYKAVMFGISAMYTGMAGGLGALLAQFVSPDSFHIGLSILFLVGIVVGGSGSLSGALFGAIFIQYVPHVAENISKSAPAAIYGVLLIVLVYFFPTGIAGVLRRLASRRTVSTANK